MMNQQAMDALYSATYVEDFLDSVENLPDDIQRNISRMRDLDYSYSDYMQGLESVVQELMQEYDYEQETQTMTEERLETLSAEEELERFRRHKNYVKTRNKVQDFLIRAQDIGDEKLQLAQNVQDNIENKARQLELDKKNLGEYTKLRPREYGKEMESSQEASGKDEKDKPGVKRARRARHDVHVPSIMGPSTLAVTSYASIMEAAGPSKMVWDKVKPHNDPPIKAVASTSSSSGKDKSFVVEEKTFGKGGSRSSKNNDSGDSEGVVSTKAERSSVSAAAAKTTKKEKDAAIVEKKGKGGSAGGGGGKKNSTKAKQKNQDSSSSSKSKQDDNDPIDPDEPTYCLCDQISYGEMIGCDNDLCPIEWFHFSCVSLSNKPKGKWYCPRCRGDKPNIMKTRAVLIKELAKYNREREEKA